MSCFLLFHLFFFFNDTATTEIYTLSLHDALPISAVSSRPACSAPPRWCGRRAPRSPTRPRRDRKSTRLNSSHSQNLVCRLLLEKKKKQSFEQHKRTVSNRCSTVRRPRVIRIARSK